MSLGTNPMDGGGSRETATSCDVRGVDTETWTSYAGDPLPLNVPSLLTAHRATFFTGVRCGGAVTYGVRGEIWRPQHQGGRVTFLLCKLCRMLAE